MVQLYRATDLQEEKVRILRALGASDDSEFIERTLKFSLSVSGRKFTFLASCGSYTAI